jgi:hypothetical protein
VKKSKIKISDFESQGGVTKLERDGHTREEITKTMYKMTDGMSDKDRQTAMSKFYDRRFSQGMAIKDQRRIMQNLLNRRK